MDVLLRSRVVITPSFRLRPRAQFFRTAAALWAISNASRSVTTASARTARRPMQLVSTGGSTWRALVQSHGHRGGARAAVENDPSTEPRPKRVRFVDEPERLGESRADERRQPNRYE